MSSNYRVLFEYVALLLIIIVPLSVQAGIFGENAINSPIMESEMNLWPVVPR